MNRHTIFQGLGDRSKLVVIRASFLADWSRRGQTRIESAVALGALIIAGAGAWILYSDSIVETFRAMLGFFSSNESG